MHLVLPEKSVSPAPTSFLNYSNLTFSIDIWTSSPKTFQAQDILNLVHQLSPKSFIYDTQSKQTITKYNSSQL